VRRPFEVIVRRHRAALLAYARRMLRGSGADPEDVLQYARIRAHAALRADSRAIALQPWLYMIVRNRALDSLRGPRPARGGFDDALAAHPGGLYPCAVLERREELRTLTGAMAALPTRRRAALVMHVLDGRSHREVARASHLGAGHQVPAHARAPTWPRRPAWPRSLCPMLDTDAIAATLDRLEEGLRECRAALELARDDPAALGELGPTVDAMASELADLKSATAIQRF